MLDKPQRAGIFFDCYRLRCPHFGSQHTHDARPCRITIYMDNAVTAVSRFKTQCIRPTRLAVEANAIIFKRCNRLRSSFNYIFCNSCVTKTGSCSQCIRQMQCWAVIVTKACCDAALRQRA
ncbi:hypothetical protein D9M69_599560 [compost metagenome]